MRCQCNAMSGCGLLTMGRRRILYRVRDLLPNDSARGHDNLSLENDGPLARTSDEVTSK